MKAKRAALYLRVSTGEQTTENQRLELEAVAARAGWEIVAAYEDAGISGAKGRNGRPGLDAMLKDATARKFDLIATWSVDRLGRSLQDLVSFLCDLEALKVDLYLHQQAVDTSTPAGRALFQMMGVFAEFERSIISERVKSGLSRAREKGTKSGKAIGRPAVARAKTAQIKSLRNANMSTQAIANKLGIGKASVIRALKG